MAYDMKINEAALESGAPFPVPDAQHGEVDEAGFETKEANNRRHRRLQLGARSAGHGRVARSQVLLVRCVP